MRTYHARIDEIRLDHLGRPSAWISCPAKVRPGPGEYVLGWSPDQPDAPLAQALFPAQVGPNGFLAAGPLPRDWLPGMSLELRGPLGHGFALPTGLRRLALAALEAGLPRLLPLATEALALESAVTVFSDPPLPSLPAAIEVFPLSDLPEALSWADLLAVDLPRDQLPKLRDVLGVSPEAGLPCPIQALVWTEMPCGGEAECGACAVQAPRGWKLACMDGPVFDLNELAW